MVFCVFCCLFVGGWWVGLGWRRGSFAAGATNGRLQLAVIHRISSGVLASFGWESRRSLPT